MTDRFHNNNEINEDKEKRIQPSMRFKPRTDLERIFDLVNSKSYGTLNKTFLNTNLKTIDQEKRRKSQEEEETKNASFMEVNKFGYTLEEKKVKIKQEKLLEIVKNKKNL